MPEAAEIEVMRCNELRATKNAARRVSHRKRQRPRHVVLQRLHIRPSRIPAAGSVMFAASASGRYPG